MKTHRRGRRKTAAALKRAGRTLSPENKLYASVAFRTIIKRHPNTDPSTVRNFTLVLAQTRLNLTPEIIAEEFLKYKK